MKKEIIDFGNGFGLIKEGKESVVVDYLEIPELNVPEPEWPWLSPSQEQEEFRLYIPEIDDSTGELLRRLAKIYSERWRFPYKDSYRLLSGYRCIGYKLKDLLNLSPLELEKYLLVGLKEEIRGFYEELTFSGEAAYLDYSPEELLEALEEDPIPNIPDEIIINWIIQKRIQNFTGEVRLSSDKVDDDESEKGKEEINPEVFRYIKCIVTCISGKLAYEYSLKAKAAGNVKIKNLIKKAWEIRKSLPSNATIEERLEAARKIFL